MNKKVECIKRLFKKNQAYEEIAEWLLSIKLTTKYEIDLKTRDQERAEFILEILEKAEADGTFMLLDFEWTVLPLEQIQITCVTEREEVHFSYGY